MIRVNESCAGCGKCVKICPEGIEMKEGIAVIKNEKATCIQEAAEACPLNAIIIE